MRPDIECYYDRQTNCSLKASLGCLIANIYLIPPNGRDWSETNPNPNLTLTLTLAKHGMLKLCVVFQPNFHPDWSEGPELSVCGRLIAAGAEGSVYEAQLCIQRQEHKTQELICAKYPWMDGTEGLKAVLQVPCSSITQIEAIVPESCTLVIDYLIQETSVLMHFNQHCKRHHEDADHVVGLIGFSVTLPTVAILMPLCTGGNLCQWLCQASRTQAPPRTYNTANEIPSDALLSESSITTAVAVDLSAEERLVEEEALYQRVDMARQVSGYTLSMMSVAI